MNKKITSLLITAGLVLGASQAFAALSNITIQDWNAGGGFAGDTFNGVGIGNEDQETEPGTVHNQYWDMEAFVYDNVSKKLYVVGGYNMKNGYGGYAPGDLFIKIGTQPTFNPTAPSGNVANGAYYNYDYAIDLSPLSTASVISLSGSSQLATTANDYLASNPWRYASGGAGSSAASTTFTDTPLSDSGVDTFFGSSLGLLGGSHYILSVDMSFLSVAPGTQVWFSYTMECGNDSLKGQYGGGFDRVPDASASVLLVGLGMTAMSLFALKRRKA